MKKSLSLVLASCKTLSKISSSVLLLASNLFNLILNPLPVPGRAFSPFEISATVFLKASSATSGSTVSSNKLLILVSKVPLAFSIVFSTSITLGSMVSSNSDFIPLPNSSLRSTISG